MRLSSTSGMPSNVRTSLALRTLCAFAAWECVHLEPGRRDDVLDWFAEYADEDPQTFRQQCIGCLGTLWRRGWLTPPEPGTGICAVTLAGAQEVARVTQAMCRELPAEDLEVWEEAA